MVLIVIYHLLKNPVEVMEMKKRNSFYNKLPPKLVKFTEKILEKLGFAGALRLILFKIILPNKSSY